MRGERGNYNNTINMRIICISKCGLIFLFRRYPSDHPIAFIFYFIFLINIFNECMNFALNQCLLIALLR